MEESCSRVDARRPVAIETDQAIAIFVAAAKTAANTCVASARTSLPLQLLLANAKAVVAASTTVGIAKTVAATSPSTAPFALLLLPTALLPCRFDHRGKLPSTVRFKTTRGKTASMGSVICRSMENSLCERTLGQLGKRKGFAALVRRIGVTMRGRSGGRWEERRGRTAVENGGEE
jgi:hypothetical protein